MTQETIKPEAGMGATIGWNGDNYPYTIHKVSENLKTIWASRDDYKVTGGPYPEGTQYFPCEFSNQDGNDPKLWKKFTLRKNGNYVSKGSMRNPWGTLQIGHRTYSQNPSF